MADQHLSAPARPRRLRAPVRAAWLIVLTMMLTAAAWSISTKLTAWGMDHRLAWALSLMFDLAGLICATYASRAIDRGSPAGLARAAVLGFVLVSGALNWSHGQQIGGPVAAWGLASVSLAVELLFELHRRDVRDEQRAARGLIAERLPHIPLIGWVLYPGRAWRTLRAAVGTRLDSLDAAPTPVVVTRGAPAPAPVAPAPGHVVELPPTTVIQYRDARCAVIRPLYADGTRPGTATMRAALQHAGHGIVSDSTIRGVIRAEVEEHEPELAQYPSAVRHAG
jgi:hypothetical protein